MSYEEYEKEVTKALDKWADLVLVAPRSSMVPNLKEAADDLITSWKESYPRRKAAISAYVGYYIGRKFNTQ